MMMEGFMLIKFSALASHILADYCLENSCLFKSKSVLELGSGLGLTGLLLVKSLDLNSYTFTDHHSKVLEFLQHNVTINLSPKQEKIGEYSTKYNNTSVQIQCLDWEAFHYSQKYDIILGADVVFDRRLIPHLINVVLKSLNRRGKAIFASTIRNVDTYNYFLHKLEEKKLKIECTEERKHKGSLSQTDVSIVKIITFQIEEEIRTTQE
ncbi:Protein-lysine N-methyltransferase EEF2KMT [Armadillidium nasatum]|uniref:Protein-lysine N-methyltransferase EEF2KMT n=1 Tax=Armadillidium nasatum TaxID=96803 RepID=A0A5N5T2I0_9CRUS|nr:Protein-lysine N-methyltransferase EEF2KMT [Armadillidium nasatum]